MKRIFLIWEISSALNHPESKCHSHDVTSCTIHVLSYYLEDKFQTIQIDVTFLRLVLFYHSNFVKNLLFREASLFTSHVWISFQI